MLKPVAILITALFGAVTSVAYAADQDPVLDQGTPAAEGRGDPTGASAGEAVDQGAPAAEGRGDPTGAAAGGDVTSPMPTGPGRSDNQ